MKVKNAQMGKVAFQGEGGVLSAMISHTRLYMYPSLPFLQSHGYLEGKW